MYFIDKLERGLGNIPEIPLATIILGAMSKTAWFKGAKKALSYTRILMHIFKHFNVDVTSELHCITLLSLL